MLSPDPIQLSPAPPSTKKSKTKRKPAPTNTVRITSSQIGCATNPGHRYQELNQDHYVNELIEVERHLTDAEKEQELESLLSFRVVGVFDGHNVCGEMAAKVAGDETINFLKKFAEEKWRASPTISVFDITDEEINQMFLQIHQSILDSYSKVPEKYIYPKLRERTVYTLEKSGNEHSYSSKGLSKSRIDFGTTAVICILFGKNRVVVASVGDSGCVVGRQEKDELKAELINEYHNPKNQDEVNRIKRDFPSAYFTYDGYLSIPDETTGLEYQLAMTRALGHQYLSKNGVIPNPSIKRLNFLPGRECCIIVASDGVWDVISEREAVSFVSDYESPDKAAQALVESGVTLGSEVADNTTAVVVFL